MDIQNNRVVMIDYKLSNKEGKLLDSSEGNGPLAYLHGHKNIIPGLENALLGKVEGDSLTVTVPAAEAYGDVQPGLIQTAARDQFPAEVELVVGMQFQAEIQGHPVVFKVESIEEDKVTVNGNHELAGVDLTFDVTVLQVREGTEEEIAHGHLHTGGGCCGGGSCDEQKDGECCGEHDKCGCE